MKNYYLTNKFKYRLQRLRRKCEKLNLPFDLDLEYFESLKVERCPVLGLQIDYEATGRPGANCFSLDRIVPEKGYVKGNVQIISYKANLMKQNASVDELLDFANWIKRTFEGQSDRFG